MNCFSILLCFSLFLVSSQTTTEAVRAKQDGVYIVYMGAAPSSTRARRNDHDQLLNSMLKRKKDVVYSYNNGFSGFAARLSEEEARSIAQRPGVVSVFPDPLLQLHTTRSWDFLKYQTDVEINLRPTSGSNSSSNGEDTIIGIMDTGIWPESKSFNDKDIGPIPPKWKGSCMQGSGFTSSNCNRKLIGARYYDDSESSTSSGSPRDQNGHGTHVAATAAGSPVEGASYRGLAEGIAKGGSPGSRIAMYRVCTLNGCRGSAILKAFDDAIADGVDILSLSLGASAGSELEFSVDPIAIGAFHAVEKGILVVCSAGNDGPARETVVNVAPWILTVAATTIDRQFESDVVLGGNKVIKGGGINFANIQKSPIYPLIYGPSAKDSAASDDSGRTCIPGALDKDKVKGKIIVCENSDGEYSPKEKLQTVISQGGIGVVLIDDDATTVASIYGSSPLATVTKKDGSEIISYINSTRNPTATILPTVTVTKYTPAPSIAYFSARGPAFNTRNLLKPDIAAPGVDILAAWPSNVTEDATEDAETSPPFNILSGTSMACPHASGIAATVKSQYPSWSASAIRSAIMTTAIQTNNLKAQITTNSGEPATPYDSGAGEVSTTGPFQPGLVYETEITEYLQFLCNNGYDISKIKLISPDLPKTFSCPSNSSGDLISNMNYPSIAVSGLKVNEWKKVLRTATSVGEDESVYTATVDTPTGLEVQVTPNKLQFTKNDKKLSYEVAFKPSGAVNGDLFGSISWTNGKYRVRSPFVVSQ
ncbi:CO(2)-response secreted protease-like [Coffea arabica]|uniref:CO(2)-response secreted protease-like n=1 Tax=Coffea arabica TaxID=13443 RepID=A0ABM4VXI9_COFAR